MIATGYTEVFPREDNVYTKKESLAYDEFESLIWADRPSKKKERF